MIKNVAGKVAVFAWDSGAGAPKTGLTNIVAQISLDGGAGGATNDVNPTELSATNHPGVYIFDLLAAETNADMVVITPSSVTAGIVFKPVVAYPTTLTPTKSGYLDIAVSTRAAPGAIMGKSPATLAAADVSGNLPVQVKAQDDIDFGALQKTSLNAATPASVQNIPATGSGFTALGDTRLVNLDATIASRSTLTAQQVWEYTTRTLSAFGSLVADAAAAVWASLTRSLTDKAGFTISGTKQTLDGLNDITAAAVWAVATRALTDKAGFSISGTTATLDALATLLRGADNDTLKTLSEQIDLAALEATLTAIKGTGWTTETLKAIKAAIPDAVDLTAITALIVRALGLAGENMVMDQTVFDADKKLTSARVRIYDSAAHALAAGDTGVIATFPLAMTWVSKLLHTMTQVES